MSGNEQLVAWIEIWHPMSNMRINTIKELCGTRSNALDQFNELHKVISKWTSEYDGIIVDTDIGMLRLPSTFIASSILQIKVDYETAEESE